MKTKSRHIPLWCVDVDPIPEPITRPKISPAPICAACGATAQGNYSIHRDGFEIGPEVDLCDACGGDVTPTLSDLWERIASRRKGARQ